MSLRNSTAERRGQQNACVWQTWQGYYLRFVSWSSLKLMFSGLFQKHLFKGRWSLTEIVFEQNFCHACLARFAVFFPLPSCCVSLLLYTQWTRQWWHNTTNLHEGTDCHNLQANYFSRFFLIAANLSLFLHRRAGASMKWKHHLLFHLIYKEMWPNWKPATRADWILCFHFHQSLLLHRKLT